MLKTLDELEVSGRRVLIRSDLNVPMADGAVTDTTRIDAAADTIRQVRERGGRPIVMSHLGRPDGQRREELSLEVVRQPLSEALGGARVALAPDCIGRAASEAAIDSDADVVLLENLRFHTAEMDNDPVFAVELASLGDVYVNDACSVCHRRHASVVALSEKLPAVAGRLLQRGIAGLEGVFVAPARPAMALVGGVKVTDKLAVIERLCERFDWIAVGGGVANTFLKAEGFEIGRSVYEEVMLAAADEIRQRLAAQGSELILPTDVVVVDAEGESARTTEVAAVGAEERIVDIGSRSVARIVAQLDKATVAAWAGPLGAADRGFDTGTAAVAQAVAEHTRTGALRSVAGGGETLEALTLAGWAGDFSCLSLGGGAFLKWVSGESLPGLQALLQAAHGT